MVKNPIQFQKGLSLTNFLSQYGDETKCYKALLRFRSPNGFVCPRCGRTDHCRIETRKVLQCTYCHSQTSLTARTILASTKLPLAVWFLGIYLITQSKDGVSLLNLGRTLGVSANTALRIKHKLQQMMKERDDTQPLHKLIWSTMHAGAARNPRGFAVVEQREKTPFVASISLSEEGKPVKMRLSRVIAFSKDEIAAWARLHLASGSLVVSDGPNCFPAITEVL